MIDLNADLGEMHASHDAEIMPFLTSCNVAAGGHAGNRASMHSVITLAIAHGVAVGAHPAYPDRAHFGRKHLDIQWELLEASLEEQIGDFLAVAGSLGVSIHHIKPHGALYNDLMTDGHLAEAFVGWINKHFPQTSLYGMPGSAMEQAANVMDHPFVAEGFVDRKYEANGRLRSRTLEDAVLVNTKDVLKQTREMVFNQRVKTTNQSWQPLKVRTLCLHGDTPRAVALAKSIYKLLTDEGAELATMA